MKAIDTLRKQLEAMGATLDESDRFLNCDAPNGYVWKDTGCTSVLIQFSNGSQTWLVKAIKDAMEDLVGGLEKVTDKQELERFRWDMGEDDWGAPADAPDFIPWGGLVAD